LKAIQGYTTKAIRVTADKSKQELNFGDIFWLQCQELDWFTWTKFWHSYTWFYYYHYCPYNEGACCRGTFL